SQRGCLAVVLLWTSGSSYGRALQDTIDGGFKFEKTQGGGNETQRRGHFKRKNEPPTEQKRR
ncbi:hypothetical protein CHS0354_017350, partial [Potamilus streckersoni]